MAECLPLSTKESTADSYLALNYIFIGYKALQFSLVCLAIIPCMHKTEYPPNDF